MSEQEEKRNKRTGAIVSVSIHATLLLLFAFLMAWREPNPPLPEYGIELNFGLDDAGTGDVQPLTPVEDTENLEEAAPEEETTEVQEEEDMPAEVPEESPEEVPEVTETFEDTESPDVVPEQEEEVKEEVVEEVPEIVEETKETVQEPKEDKPEEETVVEGAQGTQGEETDPEAVNQGDKTDETGDQGSEQGKLDERALYGNPGGGGGSSLEMAGWMWDSIPKVDDKSDEGGRIVFEIKIDDQGEIISIRTVEKTVSPSVEQIYKDVVENLTFSKTDNLPPAPQSVGRINFIIRSN
jgi:outer membrane biosynthesis protein TonB